MVVIAVMTTGRRRSPQPSISAWRRSTPETRSELTWSTSTMPLLTTMPMRMMIPMKAMGLRSKAAQPQTPECAEKREHQGDEDGERLGEGLKEGRHQEDHRHQRQQTPRGTWFPGPRRGRVPTARNPTSSLRER